MHGVLNSGVGSKKSFIYLSDRKIDEKYKSNMNLMKPTDTCIKIGFRKKTYRYLSNVLPPKQLMMLEKSYAAFQRK